LLCTQASILDVLYLITNYSPTFTYLCTYKGKHGYRVLGFYERFVYGLCIRFPREVGKDECHKLKEIQAFFPHKPIVVFPEGTKTNGNGILEFPSEIADELVTVKGIHSLRFEYTFQYFYIYNTTETRAIKHLLTIFSQTLNRQKVQYLFNVHKRI
jgi:hypothetical protein